MRAMVLRKIAPIQSSPLELADWPLPEPGGGETRFSKSSKPTAPKAPAIYRGEFLASRPTRPRMYWP